MRGFHAFVAAWLVAAAPVAAQQTPVLALTDVPPLVLNTARAAAGGLPLAEVRLAIDEEGRPVYQLSGVAEGKTFTLAVTGAGVLDGIQYQVARSDLPADVAALLTKMLPQLSGATYERDERPDGSVSYDVTGRVDGTEVTVKVAQSAEMMSIWVGRVR